MKHNDLKESYRGLVNQLKEEGKRKGAKITNEFIAESLGYERSYFSTLLGERGNVTEDHIKDLILHFPNELGGKIQHEPQLPPGNKGPDYSGQTIHNLSESLRSVTESNREMVELVKSNLSKIPDSMTLLTELILKGQERVARELAERFDALGKSAAPGAPGVSHKKTSQNQKR